VKSVSSSLFNLKTAFLGLGAGLVAKSFINAASAAEQYQIRLEILLGSQEEGNKVFKETAEYASKVSFQYEELMAGATALGGVLEGGSEDIKRWLPLIGDLAAASGLAIQDTISNFIRMYSAGAASADLFRERGILAMLGFQAGVTYSAEETRKRLIEAWEDPLSKFRGAATALSSTWDGLLSMMADRWFQFRSMVMDAGLYNYIKNAV
jgi:phage tail tape-measure protein